MQTETASVHVPCAIAVGIANDDRIRIITAVRHVESDVGHACDAVDVQQLALQPAGQQCCTAHTRGNSRLFVVSPGLAAYSADVYDHRISYTLE